MKLYCSKCGWGSYSVLSEGSRCNHVVDGKICKRVLRLSSKETRGKSSKGGRPRLDGTSSPQERKSETVQFQITATQQIHELATQRAKDLNISVSEYIRNLIEDDCN